MEVKLVKEKYILGIDLGVGSVGWSCMAVNNENEPIRIIDLGSRVFSAENGSMEDRRNARGLRRLLRRRKARIQKTKNLFISSNYFTKDEMNLFFEKEACKYDNPYLLKVKGLNNKLTIEELLICLVHYSKYRGFKSNRKVKDEHSANSTASASEDQKLLYSIQTTENELINNQWTISEYIVNDPKFKDKIKNTSGEYKIGITREMIVQEAELLLNKQIEMNVISDQFKNDYLTILTKQLSFSEGPEWGPYHNPLSKMIGICKFDKQDRAPITSYSYELFIMIQKLRNITYYEEGCRIKNRLNNEQIQKLLEEAVSGKEIKYKNIQKVIGHQVNFPGLLLTKNDFMKIVSKSKEEKNKDKTLEELKNEAKNNISVYEMKNTKILKSQLKKLGYENVEVKVLDALANLLSRYKSDDEIRKGIEEDELLKNQDQLFKAAILKLDEGSFKEFGKLSFNMLYQLLPLMINEGMDYAQAMAALNLDHSQAHKNDTDYEELPPLKEVFEELDKTVTNRSVIATLQQTKMVINAIFARYGKPVAIHVEVARELTKNDTERKQLMDMQLSNQVTNTSLKMQIFNKYSDQFTSMAKISHDDLVKYKLFIEQGGIDPYTLALTNDEMAARINEKTLFTREYEIDHIMPYSISFNDTFANKTLVRKERNLEKANNLPYEVFGRDSGYAKYEAWVRRTINDPKKQEIYLLKEIPDDLQEEFSARALNDTRYATKVICEILKYCFPSIKVKSFTGQITDKLKGVWGLKNLTHSYQNPSYILHDEFDEELKKKYDLLSIYITEEKNNKEIKKLKEEVVKLEKQRDQKNRKNHLHHALDAAIIACATDSLRRRVEIHEQNLRQNSSTMRKFKVSVVDPATGEISTQIINRTVADYGQLYDLTKNSDPRHFPMPYDSFRDEIKLRLYERDEATMKRGLMCLANYNAAQVNQCKPVIISHQYTKKVNGRLHKATIYGVAPKPKTENTVVLTNRMAVTDKKFDYKQLDKIYDKEGTQKAVYEAVKSWLSGYANGEEAYNSHKELPKNSNGNPIKKVKLDYDSPKEEILLHEEKKQYVEKENVIQTHVFRREDSDKLYFIGMDRYRVMNFKNDPVVLIWWGRSKNNRKIKYSELAREDYIPYVKLYKNQIILLELRNGAKGLCKVNGFSAGMFEITSILGDDYDILASGLQTKSKSRLIITVSTIKSIQPINVDILGKVHL
ncbi:MAG: type II CRISPR RNA-guided endonuclease Cas9 [Dielma fastidiosa]|nr:MAG: type II CRISPR RNA-guided endonuclease Cas9 [Dielma fastidiosa]